MEDTYTFMRIISGSWGTVYLVMAFLAIILFTLRPGSRRAHDDSAQIPFRHDDKPASQTAFDPAQEPHK
jgi:cytochrome c oxidase cbb3-type subunit 4